MVLVKSAMSAQVEDGPCSLQLGRRNEVESKQLHDGVDECGFFPSGHSEHRVCSSGRGVDKDPPKRSSLAQPLVEPGDIRRRGNMGPARKIFAHSEVQCCTGAGLSYK